MRHPINLHRIAGCNFEVSGEKCPCKQPRFRLTEPGSGVEAAPTTVIRKIEDVLEMWANSIGKSGHKKFSRKNMIQFAMCWGGKIRLLALSSPVKRQRHQRSRCASI